MSFLDLDLKRSQDKRCNVVDHPWQYVYIPGNTKCQGQWNILKELGSGLGGVVYSVDNGREKFALKLTTGYINDLQREVYYHQRAAEAGLAVKIIQVMWNTPNKPGAYIMAALNQTLSSVTEDPGETIETKLRLFDELRSLVSRLHDIGIVHGDLSFGNIMLDANRKLYLIDFERASILTEELAKKELDMLESEIQQAVDWLYYML